MVRHPRKVRAREVGVCCKVNKAEIDDELDDLKARDPLFPPDANASRRLEVVPVHDNMDKEVDGDDDPGDGSQPNELCVAEKGSCAVVIGVQEG